MDTPEVAEVAQESNDISGFSDADLDRMLEGENEGSEAVEPVTEKENSNTTEDSGQQEAATPTQPLTPAPIPMTEAEKLAKQQQDKEAFITKQRAEMDRLQNEINANANVVGELRKRALMLRGEAEEAGETLTAIDKANEAREAEARAYNLELENIQRTTKQVVSVIAPEFETYIPEMEAIIKEQMTSIGKNEAESAALAAEFKNAPYATQPATLAMLAEAAKARREINSLKAELAKEQAKSQELAKKPAEVLKSIAKAAESPPVLNNKSTFGHGSTPGTFDGDLADLSDEQLNALLEKAKNNSGG